MQAVALGVCVQSKLAKALTFEADVSIHAMFICVSNFCKEK